MKLTPANKSYIDSLGYEELLRRWRFGLPGEKWFGDDTGRYWRDRIEELRPSVDHAAISKKIGWVKKDSEPSNSKCDFCFDDFPSDDSVICEYCNAIVCSDEHLVNHEFDDCTKTPNDK